MNDEDRRLQATWDVKAEEWHMQVGEEGDRNRRFNSDPVLWRMLGAVAGKRVLDAGCGTGYLAIKLAALGADVVGVDLSPAMLEIARRRVDEAGVRVELHVSSCADLSAIASASVDAAVSNYVLMDVRDMHGVVRELYRVLRPGGHAVLIFSHPAFTPPGGSFRRDDDGSIEFRWVRPYFDDAEYEESWGHFTTPFVGFHRPLSGYWRAFRDAGFLVTDFDEPIVSADCADLPAESLRRMRSRPDSVAFRLLKPA